jgi:hypothetical protein
VEEMAKNIQFIWVVALLLKMLELKMYLSKDIMLISVHLIEKEEPKDSMMDIMLHAIDSSVMIHLNHLLSQFLFYQ